MIQALFHALVEEGDGLQAKVAVARTEEGLTLTDFERATFPSNPGVVRFPKILRFTTINLVKAGWLRKKSGVWTLTEDGAAALEQLPDPEALFKESRRLYREWKAQQPSTDDAVDEVETAEETGLIAAATLEEAEESARTDIVDYMGSLNPYDFQDLVDQRASASSSRYCPVAR